MCLHETDKAAEDTEFKFEFDAVYHWFESCLDDKIIHKLKYQENNIHHNDQGIDGEKLVHNLAVHAVVAAVQGWHAKDPDRIEDLEARNDKFLEAKSDELDAFYQHITTCPGGGTDEVGT